jgi:hypothetical protein
VYGESAEGVRRGVADDAAGCGGDASGRRPAVRWCGDDTGQIGIRRDTSMLRVRGAACPRGMASSATKMK